MILKETKAKRLLAKNRGASVSMDAKPLGALALFQVQRLCLIHLTHFNGRDTAYSPNLLESVVTAVSACHAAADFRVRLHRGT